MDKQLEIFNSWLHFCLELHQSNPNFSISQLYHLCQYFNQISINILSKLHNYGQSKLRLGGKHVYKYDLSNSPTIKRLLVLKQRMYHSEQFLPKINNIQIWLIKFSVLGQHDHEIKQAQLKSHQTTFQTIHSSNLFEINAIELNTLTG